MTQEEKQLLLKDLCARLPYNIIVRVEVNDVFIKPTDEIATTSTINMLEYSQKFRITPYLRPMSSMTEEEYNKYELTFDNVMVYSGHNNNNIHSEHRPTYETFDYLDSIYVDYRGLIEKGLALEAPKGMYN